MSLKEESVLLAEKALAVRRDVIRMTGLARSGFPASSLSIVDILVWLYWKAMSLRTDEPSWDDRDRFVLGKGRGCPALYAVLANRSFFPREELWSYRRLGAMLQGFPEVRRTPGVDAPGGSPGQGLGLANGLSLALKGKSPQPSVFCLVGDAELQEGVFWESAMTSAHFSLENIVLIVDRDGRQIDTPPRRSCPSNPSGRNLPPLAGQLRSATATTSIHWTGPFPPSAPGGEGPCAWWQERSAGRESPSWRGILPGAGH